MKSKIALATTLLMLGGFAGAALADECSLGDALKQTSDHLQSEMSSGKLKPKVATEIQKELENLQVDLNKAETKSGGKLSDADMSGFRNRIAAFDRKVGRDANPNRVTDVKNLALVRRAIEKDSSLSGEAKNVKISFEDGCLVLDGKVKSDAERERLVNVVKDNGFGNVTDKMTVK